MPRRITFFALLILLLGTHCAKDRIYNALTVSGGSGSGVYALGEVVQIVADTPATGYGFYRWIGDTRYLDDPGAPIAQCTMPLRDIELQAAYLELPTYLLTVEGGEGSGRYLEGTIVQIRAIPAADTLSFTIWEGDIQHLRDEEDEVTQVTMPAQDIAVKANFEPNNLVSFEKDIYPLFVLRCHNCHGEPHSNPYVTYQEIKADITDIRISIEIDYMPTGNPLPPAEKELIFTWIEQGARNN